MIERMTRSSLERNGEDEKELVVAAGVILDNPTVVDISSTVSPSTPHQVGASKAAHALRRKILMWDCVIRFGHQLLKFVKATGVDKSWD